MRTVIGMCGFMIVYSLTVISAFLYSGTAAKVLILLVVHRGMAEMAITSHRFEYLQVENYSSPIKRTVKNLVVEGWFSIIGRLFLCNMGSQGATLISVFLQAVLQGVFRGTIVSRDRKKLLREYASDPKYLEVSYLNLRAELK